MTRKRLVAVTALVAMALTAGVVVGVRLLGDDDRSDIESAVAMAPPDARRLLWTDWAGIRAEVDLELDSTSSGDQVQTLLDRGYEADLTSASALGSSALAMQESLGFSPATLEWELFSQSESGASLLMRLGSGVTLGDVAAQLRAVGYEESDGLLASDGSEDLITAEVTPELAFVSLDAGDGLVVAGDSAGAVRTALDAVADAGSEPVPAEVVTDVAGALTAVVYTGEEACSALAMARADPAEQSEGDSLVAQAGKINPLTGFAIAALPGGGVRVAMGFENEEQSRTNADSRAALAAGPAPGQGGAFADRFAVDEVSADGTVVTLQLSPVDGAYVVSDLSTGPVLFATC